MKKLLGTMMIGAAIMLGGCESKTEPVAESGDTVIINFAGFLGNEQFEGGTAENFPLKLGSGQFVPGFEDQLIGTKKGEEKDVNVTFPENYYPNLAGKDVVFKVKIVDIQK